MPQPPALKPPSTARTAGRSDRAERRLRHQPFILLFVGASSISLIPAESGENSLIPLRLLFPPNPLRWASAGALFSSDNRLICPKYAEGASHTARGKPLRSSFKSHSHKRLTFAFTLEIGYTTRPHSQERTQRLTRANRACFRWWVLSLPSDRFARFGNPARPGVRTAYFAAFEPWSRGALEECRKPAGQRCAYVRRCSEASRPRWAALPAAASCAASTISEVRYPCTEAQRKNYRLRHTSDCPASLACTLLRAADSSNAQSCRS